MAGNESLLEHLRRDDGSVPEEFAHLVTGDVARRWAGRQRADDMFPGDEPYSPPMAYRSREDLDDLLRYAARNRANDLHIGDGAAIKIRVEGTLYTLTDRTLTNDEVKALMVALYADSSSIITAVLGGARKDLSYQCGGFGEAGEVSRWRVFIALRAVGGGVGFRIVCRQISIDPPTIDEVYMPRDIVESVERLQRGIFLMTGPTGSGKTTSLAALLRHRLESPQFSDHLITAEWPIEYVYDRVKAPHSVVTQWEIPRMMPSFRDSVVAALRGDPDLFLLGEMRDRQTMEAGLEVSLTGHGLLSTMHTNSVVQTVSRILTSFDEGEREAVQFDLVDNLHMIVSQLLCRGPDGRRVALRERLAIDGSAKERLRTAKNLAGALRHELESSGRLLVEEARELHREGRLADAELTKIEYLDRQERSSLES